MAKEKSGVVTNGSADSSKTSPRSAAHFDRGIHDDIQFANASIAVAGDLVNGAITPSVGNAVCANMRNVLKVVELKHKYGVQGRVNGSKTLRLSAA
jgi:hypothetical protein